ncbi:MAG TPA: rhomboid family intramembrane serine protease [Clostridia bacterium]|jgi:membrane associated rhomboid family serine protease|nr:rhomboid family intramembrane serine protease [Clostridia bacterium]
MIPLRDSTRSRTFPLVTISLILLNLYFFYQQASSTPQEMEQLILNYGFTPALLTEQIKNYSLWGFFHPPLLTAIFLHGSWFHLLSNMLYLWIFGDNIEDKLGHFRFLLFYLFTGIIANLIYYLTAINSPLPLVGASGAIAGILGAYFITFPRAKITTLFFVFIFVFLRQIPAVFFLFVWFVLQVINGIGTMNSPIAWWAHIGGFISGFILMPFLKKHRLF